MKASRRCPKCQSTDLRWQLLSLDHVNVSPVGPGFVVTPDLVRIRLFDAYICAGCGFTEFYFRT
jgi:predicted nucleic-acid-binding Zn-ribbon protein